MKRLIALLLVLCTVFGLVACGGKKPAENTDSTTPTGNKPGNVIVTPETSPYNGKTLQIYGNGTADSYTDYENFGKGNYIWMMRAAMDEWATMNGVTLVFEGSYNQNALLAAMNSGANPDIIFATEQFPKSANAGLIAPFTDEEYKKLSDICGKGYLDLMTYKTKSHGFVFPWSGNTMCYYNKTMFENYGVKTPKEYFMEGEWTWSNFQKCIEQMTKDVDSDGEIDTYGLPADSLTWCRMVNDWKMDETGKLVSRIDEQMIQDFFQFKYDSVTVKKIIQSPGKHQIQKNVTYPMCAMQLSDCEPYNFEHMYQSIPNGDELEVVPVPAYDGSGEKKNLLQWTQACCSLAASADEREAAVDLMAYLLQCGMKYISDFSLGSVKCDYPGIQGTSALSKQWKDAFAGVVAKRAADKAELGEAYDQALIDKIYASFEGAEWYTYQTFSGVSLLTSYSEITKLPPASSIPAIKEKYQAALDKFNSTYIK